MESLALCGCTFFLLQRHSPFHSVPIVLHITFPENYPQTPPTFALDKPHLFLHPNISSNTGFICEKTMNNTSGLITVRERVNAFIHLLSYPNNDDAYQQKACELYKQSPHDYYREALKKFRGRWKWYLSLGWQQTIILYLFEFS